MPFSGYRGNRHGRNKGREVKWHRGFEKEPSAGRSSAEGKRGGGRSELGERHPPHLRGRQIGLFYRDRQMKKEPLSFLKLPDDKQKKIEALLATTNQGNDDSTAGTQRSTNFEREYLDVTQVSFSEKLQQALQFNSSLTSSTCKKLNEELRSEYLKKNANKAYLKMLDFRKGLPAYLKRDEILRCIQENQVVIISGDTGCGKTTQVGQLILEEACAGGRGAEVRVLVTQPRRLAATSVAARIATERAEALGNSVGYCIRLNSVAPREYGSIEVVTAGVVLQRLQRDPALLSLSHLLLDEVHERDTTCDILLGIVKQILKKRKDLKLILMSATMEAERFCQYFGGCPMVRIPGRMFPVKEYFLEDVLEMTGFQNFREPRIPYFQRQKQVEKVLREARLKHAEQMAPLVRELRRRGYSRGTLEILTHPGSEELNAELVCTLVRHLCVHARPGAILVFLPGMSDISCVIRLLEEWRDRLPPHILLPLHSHLNALDQNAIFSAPPSGVRKIIVSTNIAETSITIDDVIYVIDSGRMKLSNYDVESDVNILKPEWVSKANAHQRRGRAGRVSAGECYRLYTSARAASLAPRPAPELLRAPVHEPLLATLLLRLHPAPAFLATLLDPPLPTAVHNAVTLLSRMGILNEREQLTPLGVHVARLPVAPGAARMLILASLFSAAAPATAVGAVVAFRDPFLLPIGFEKEVERSRRELANGTGSDQLAAAEAQRRWESLAQRGPRAAASFCQLHFLSQATLRLLRDMRQQFGQLLHAAHFLPSPDPEHPDANRHSDNVSLLKALVVAGLYPNVAGYRRKGLMTEEDGRVTLHPSSVNVGSERPASHLVYRLKQRSTDLFLHDTSAAHALPLLFFGDNIRIQEREDDECEVWSGSLGWRTSRGTAQLLTRLRAALHALLQGRLHNPSPVVWDSPEGRLLSAIIELITAEDNPAPDSDGE